MQRVTALFSEGEQPLLSLNTGKSFELAMKRVLVDIVRQRNKTC
ncbi:hypothetical protein [Vibrio neptunius]|nr:hypothetical protein [Vibrio neptunius]